LGSGSEDASKDTWETWDILGLVVGGLTILSLSLILAVRTRQLYCVKYGCASPRIAPDLEATPVEVISRSDAPSPAHTPRVHRNLTSGSQRRMCMTGTLVLSKLDFCPSEVAGSDQGFRDKCLRLRSGDVMEVVLDRENGWLFGFRVGHRAQRGYFPENRVTWIGRPVVFDGNGPSSLCSLGVPEDAQAGEIVVASARSHFPTPPTRQPPMPSAARSRSQSADERGLGSARSHASGAACAGDGVSCSSARVVGSARSCTSASRAGELVLESARSSQYSAAQSVSAPQTARSHYAAPQSARSHHHMAPHSDDLVGQSARPPYALNFARLGA